MSRAYLKVNLTNANIVKDDDIDMIALRRKYTEERDKRLNAQDDKGQLQYIVDLEKSEKWASIAMDPYNETGIIPREPYVNHECDVLCVGAGFGGLLSAARIKMNNSNANVLILEKGSSCGGTWYWNQYPGAACDVEAASYMPLIEELKYKPNRTYARGEEILEHCNNIIDRYNFRDGMVYQTKVTNAVWNESMKRWVIETNRGDTFHTKYLINASGPLAKPKLANIAGMEKYQGEYFHTSRWNYKLTGKKEDGLPGLNGLRVGIIGTGATAVQCIPQLAKSAKHLYVFQRTPSSIDIRNDVPWSQERWDKKIVNRYGNGYAYERRRFFDAVTSGGFLASDKANIEKKKVSTEERARLAQLGNFKHMERIRRRVDEIVKDKKTANALKPWYDMGCKRPCFHDEYLPTFNRPNVTLVDTDGKGIKEINDHGVVYDGHTYDVDVLIYATGFETQSSFTNRTGYDYIGRNNEKLSTKWDENGIATLWGIHTHNFPNLFIMGGSQVGFPFNFVSLLDEQAMHIANVIDMANGQSVDVTKESEEAWVNEIIGNPGAGVGGGASFLALCTPGYYNNEGSFGKNKGELGSKSFKQNANFAGGPLRYYERMKTFYKDGKLGEKFVVF